MSDFSDWVQLEMPYRTSVDTIGATGSLIVKANNVFSRDYVALAQGTSGQVLTSQGTNNTPIWDDPAAGLDINGLAVDTIAAADALAFYDDDGSHNNKITFANFEGTLDHDNLTNGNHWVPGSGNLDMSDDAIFDIISLGLTERSSDPTIPTEGECVIWMSDGTGKGDDGDILAASKVDSVTRYGIIFDYSAGTVWIVTDPFTTAGNWTVYNAESIGTDTEGYFGVGFDGKYIYFSPHNNGDYHGEVLRYDTTANFTTAGSWAAYDASGVGTDTEGYSDAIFDGRYIYFVPYLNGTAYHGEVLRYDTTAGFVTGSSWAAYDAGSVGTDTKGYYGGVFDGRYVYFVPYKNSSGYHGKVLRYDTEANFTTAGSWAFYDAGSVGSNTKGYFGAVFDGRYIYFSPFRDDSTFHGKVLRYDTQADFTTAGSWASYDAGSVGTNTKGYADAAFDGRYVYFAPYHDGSNYHGKVLRYDTTGNFTTAGSWASYDAGSVGTNTKGYFGIVFDGKYIYFVPYMNSSGRHGEVLRYDTTSNFTTAGSWAAYDASGVGSDTEGYCGAIFDNKYVYFCPYHNGTDYHAEVLRYNTTGA